MLLLEIPRGEHDLVHAGPVVRQIVDQVDVGGPSSLRPEALAGYVGADLPEGLQHGEPTRREQQLHSTNPGGPALR